MASGQDYYLEKLAEKETPGIVRATNNEKFAQQFLESIAQKRFWERM